MIDKLKQLIESSERILVTAHLGTDADSLCSCLLLFQSLKLQFPDKSVAVCLEDKASDLDFVTGYDQVEFDDLTVCLKKHKPQLLIMLDANNLKRCSRNLQINQAFAKSEAKLAIIDHHEPTDKDLSEIYLNNGSPAVTYDVYKLIKSIGYKLPAGYAQTALLGIYTDTGGFTYAFKNSRDLFGAVSELIEAGANIEQIRTNLNRFSLDEVSLLGELAANAQTTANYSYSYVSDNFSQAWVDEGKSVEAYHNAKEYFANNFIRNIDGRQWGFIVYRDIQAEPGAYGTSFRAITGTKDVSVLATNLGGGGHKPAAGAKFSAQNVEHALEKVKAVVIE